MNRKFTDVFFKHLFSIVALFSVLALGAIVLFVFIQGTVPFFTPTAQGIRLVPQRIDELTVNGEKYFNHSSFITIPGNMEIITISFPATGPVPDGEESLAITINYNEEDPQKKL